MGSVALSESIAEIAGGASMFTGRNLAAVTRFFMEAPLEEAEHASKLAALIVSGRQQQSRTGASTNRNMAMQILREHGRPMTPISLARAIDGFFAVKVSPATINSELHRGLQPGGPFTRPFRGRYGLQEWGGGTAADG